MAVFKEPKEFLKKLDQIFLIYMSLPILFFFGYYLWFLKNHKVEGFNAMTISDGNMILAVALWVVLILVLYQWKKKLLKEIRDIEDLQERMNALYVKLNLFYQVVLALFIVSLVAFHITKQHMISATVWIMFIVVSVEKPNLYRVARYLKFKTKEQFKDFTVNKF